MERRLFLAGIASAILTPSKTYSFLGNILRQPLAIYESVVGKHNGVNTPCVVRIKKSINSDILKSCGVYFVIGEVPSEPAYVGLIDDRVMDPRRQHRDPTLMAYKINKSDCEIVTKDVADRYFHIPTMLHKNKRFFQWTEAQENRNDRLKVLYS